MSKSLPQKPNLEHLRNEARDLLNAHAYGDVSCCPVLRHLRRFKDASDQEILKELVSLQEVQLALAMEYGYRGWREISDAVGLASVGREQPVNFPGGYYPPDGGERLVRLEQLLSESQATRWTNEQAVEFFRLATAIALSGGLAALEGVPAKIDDSFLRAGLQLAVDGADESIVREVMIQNKKTRLAEYERRLDMEIEAIRGMIWGDSPMVIEARCRAFLSSGTASGSV